MVWEHWKTTQEQPHHVRIPYILRNFSNFRFKVIWSFLKFRRNFARTKTRKSSKFVCITFAEYYILYRWGYSHIITVFVLLPLTEIPLPMIKFVWRLLCRIVADLRLGVYYQKCYDPDCKSIDYRSPGMCQQWSNRQIPLDSKSK